MASVQTLCLELLEQHIVGGTFANIQVVVKCFHCMFECVALGM